MGRAVGVVVGLTVGVLVGAGVFVAFGVGVLVGAGVGVFVAGVDAVTLNVPALPFQFRTLPQPGVNTPMAMEYPPVAAAVGTGQLDENVRVCPALKV